MHHGFRLIVIYAERSRYSKDRKVAGEKDKWSRVRRIDGGGRGGEGEVERRERERGRRTGVNGLIYSANSRQLSGGRDSSSNHADL